MPNPNILNHLRQMMAGPKSQLQDPRLAELEDEGLPVPPQMPQQDLPAPLGDDAMPPPWDDQTSNIVQRLSELLESKRRQIHGETPMPGMEGVRFPR